jgi:uncharacterized protein YdaU (DUF1376 family)
VKKHWMPLYIGDYLADTTHLNQGQHGAYLLFIMHYWRTGGIPLDKEQCYCIAHAMDEHTRCNADAVLKQFFRIQGARYVHKRIDKELHDATESYEKRVSAAKQRWSGKKTSENQTSNADAMHEQPQPQPHIQPQLQPQRQNPKTIQSSIDLVSVGLSSENHAPSAPPKKGTRIPKDFAIPLGTIEWAQEKHLPNPKEQIEAFVDYWTAKVGVQAYKLDWPATFRNWLRRAENYGSVNGNGKGHRETVAERNKRAFDELERMERSDS